MNENKDNKRTFDEIAAQEGEEAAIQAGIDADPDTFELDAEWFRQASPAREVIPYIRASYSWISSDDRTNFRLFVDQMLVAEGEVSEKDKLFLVISVLNETTRSFRTMRAAKNWAVEHFDSINSPATPSRISNPRASYSWISSDDRTNFRLFVDQTLVAKGQVSEKDKLFLVISVLDGTQRSFRTMQAAKNWAVERFDSINSPATPSRTSNPRASYSWISSDDRTNFWLFVGQTLVAKGEVSEKDELFLVTSVLDGTPHSFRTMRAAKNWAVEHFDSINFPATPPQPALSPNSP